MSNIIYLAAPYSHEDADIREERFIAITEIAGELISRGYTVFSPITHNHIVTKYSDTVKGYGWDSWKEYDLNMLSRCDTLLVLKLEGWRTSTGVDAEVKYAMDSNMDILFIEPRDVSDIDSYLSKHYTQDELGSL